MMAALILLLIERYEFSCVGLGWLMKTSKKCIPISGRGEDDTIRGLDIHVGKVLCSLRRIRGMTQKDLAFALNISPQQLQKNEKGLNKISCSRLFMISKILNVDLGYFFEGYNYKGVSKFFQVFPVYSAQRIVMQKASLSFLSSYNKIDASSRRLIDSLVKHLAKISPITSAKF